MQSVTVEVKHLRHPNMSLCLAHCTLSLYPCSGYPLPVSSDSYPNPPYSHIPNKPDSEDSDPYQHLAQTISKIATFDDSRQPW